MIWMRRLFSRRNRDSELAEEIREHLSERVEELVETGMPREEAEHAARREFGNIQLTKEDSRGVWRWIVLEDFFSDVRYGLRQLRKSPGFAATAILTLALGIGANTAIFSVLDAVLLRALPVAHPEELALLTDPEAHGSWFGSQAGEQSLLAYSQFEYLRDHNEVFSEMFAADSELAQVETTFEGAAGSGATDNEIARIRLVSGGYFTTLGVKAAAGRLFTSEVDRARGGSPIAVLSYAYWRQRFGLNPGVLGQSLQIHNTSFEIVGVAGPGFTGETVGVAPDLWIPMMMQEAVRPGVDLLSASQQGLVNIHSWVQVMGRLKPGVSIAQANAAVNVTFKQVVDLMVGAGLTPRDGQKVVDERIRMRPGARGASMLSGELGKPLKFLMGLVGLVLLIACVNVANMLLAQAAARQKEIAMRLSVGAARGRLIRQLLTESLLLAAIGGTVGVLLASWGGDLLVRLVSAAAGLRAVQLEVRPDGSVLAFTVGITAITAVLFGLAPALKATRVDFAPVLKATAPGSGDGLRASLLPVGKILVAGQVTITLILLVAAGLFVRSLEKLSEVNLGYARGNLLLFVVHSAAGGYKEEAATQLYQELLEKIAAVPGVQGATVSHNGLFNDTESGDPIKVEGYTPKAGEEADTRIDHVGPNYFSTIGIPILMGRGIEARDSGRGLRSAVINQTFARTYFPNANPIGKHVQDVYPGNPADTVVVGVAADAKYNSLRENARPRLYAPLFNPIWPQMTAVYEVRTFANTPSMGAALREAVRATSASLPPIEIHTMSGLLDDSLQTDQIIKQLSEAMGVLAIVLASIGLYGVMSYTVARRTREFGIRLALGAEPRRVLRHILGETLTLVFIGIGAGVPLAIGGTHLIRSMLFGLGVVDPASILVACGLLVGVALLAGLLPARRAMKVDPMVALRYE